MQLVLEFGTKYSEITGPVSDAFADELHQACSRNDFTELILDLKDIKTMSSMAMGAIFTANQKLRDAGKSLGIINASEKVTNLLRMVNMSDMLL